MGEKVKITKVGSIAVNENFKIAI